MNAIRGAADRDIDLSPPGSPLDKDDSELSTETNAGASESHDATSALGNAREDDESKPTPVVEQGRIMDTLWMSAVARRRSQDGGSGHVRRSSTNTFHGGADGEGGGGDGKKAAPVEEETEKDAVGVERKAGHTVPAGEPKEGFPAWPKDSRGEDDVSFPLAQAGAATATVTSAAAIPAAVAEAASGGGGSDRSRDSSGNFVGFAVEGRGAGLEPSSDLPDAPTEEAAPTEEKGEDWGEEGQAKSCVFQ